MYDSAYFEIITNPRVCAHCHSLLQRQGTLPDRISETKPFALPPREPTALSARDTPPGDTVSERAPRRRCDVCGHFEAPIRRRDPLTKGDAIRFTQNLSETANALSIEASEHGELRRASRFRHDRDALFDGVRHLKSQPDMQFRDRVVFAAAFEVARRRNHD